MDGRRNQDRSRQYSIKELWDKHREIARRVVLGQSHAEIAEAVGCHPQTVSNVRNSPIGRAELARLHERRDDETMSMAQKIEEFAPVALRFLEDIVNGKVDGASTALRARMASAAVARAGYGEVHRVQTLHAHLSRSDIEVVKERARESARILGVDSGEAIDVEARRV